MVGPGPKSQPLMLLIWLIGMDVCTALEQTNMSGGLYQMVHGIVYQVVEWFHELSFLMKLFMVSELTMLFGKQV